MPNKSKKKKPRSLKGPPGKDNTETPQGSDGDKLSNETTQATEPPSQAKESSRVGLPSPRFPGTSISQACEHQKPNNTESPKGNSFRRRLRALTSGSTKSSTGLNRQSWESKSSTQSPRARSGSVRGSGTQAIDIAELNPVLALTITPSPRKASSSSIAKYIRSPHDYTFIDLDYSDAQDAMNNGLNSGVAGEQSGEAKPPVVGKSSMEDLAAHVRRMTGSEKTSIDLNDPKVPRRQGDARAWNHRNLSCITCKGPCPICHVTCCVREEVKLQAADKNIDEEGVEKAKHVLKIIDYLGPFAKDAGTFSQCSPPDGCGRHVCSECCGVCPSEICRDIQCKECKPDPWGSCDWHD